MRYSPTPLYLNAGLVISLAMPAASYGLVTALT